MSSLPPTYTNTATLVSSDNCDPPPAFPAATLPEYYAPPAVTSTAPHDPDEKSASGPRSAPDNESLLPSYTPAKFGKHGRYKDEDAYLDALREWAEERSYAGLKNNKGGDTTIEGFYGAKTMTDYENQERPNFGFRRKSSAAKAAQIKGDIQASSSTEANQPGRRRSSMVNWLRRKKTETDSRAIEE